MSAFAARCNKALDACAAGLDRMVRAPEADASGADRFGARLLATLAGGAALFLLTLCLLIPGSGISAELLGLASAVLALAAVSALGAAARRGERAAGAAALAAGALAAGGVCALGGGLASPLALAALALPVEAHRLAPGTASLRAGAAAALAALAGAGLVALRSSQPPEAILWLPLVLWGAVLGLRLFRTKTAGREEPGADLLDGEAVVLRFEPGGEVADASPSARERLNLAPELLLGSGFFERLHVADRVDFLCALADLRHGAPRRRVELRVRLPRENPASRDTFAEFTLDLSLSGEAALPFLGLLRDDAALRALRAERDAALEAGERAEASRIGLMATLGHELRTPLNAIIGFAGMLGDESLGGFRDPRQKEYAALIGGCGAHLLGVMEAALDLGTLRAGGRAVAVEAFPLREAVETCRAMLALPAGAKGVTLLHEVAPDCGSVRADRRIVQQILVNLVSNAVKFTPAGGRVVIAASRRGGALHLAVSDTGVGIGAEDLEGLGTPFMRVAGQGAEGAGLGLSLVKELAALHGGTFTLRSTPGAGTVAAVTLPEERMQALPAARAGEALVSAIAGERTGHGTFRKSA